jgi:integrase
MPRKRNPHPKMIPDRATGRARCVYYDPGTGRRRTAWLGKWGSSEAEGAYAKLLLSLRTATVPAPAGSDLTVSELRVRFLRHARGYYVGIDGRPTSEFHHFKLALRELTAEGETTAASFGPVALKRVRERFVANGWGRPYVNAQTRRLRQVWRWAAENEFVPAATWQALSAVSGLRIGRTAAPEPAPVEPVDAWRVGRTLPFLPPAVAAMVRLQWHSGCRPQDVCNLRAEDLDRSGVVWVYRPGSHKTRWRGKVREVFFGPRAQAVLGDWLPESGHAFSPAREAAKRKVKKAPCPRRPPRPHYSTGTYDRAVLRGCRKAGVPPWSPNQLRHSAATRFRERFGLERTRELLGHQQTATSELYAEKSRRNAAAAALEAG